MQSIIKNMQSSKAIVWSFYSDKEYVETVGEPLFDIFRQLQKTKKALVVPDVEENDSSRNRHIASSIQCIYTVISYSDDLRCSFTAI